MLKPIIYIITYIEKILASSLILTLTLLYIINIVVRNLFPSDSNNFLWILEISKILLSWIVFSSIGLIYHYNKHIKMDLLLTKLSIKMNNIVLFVYYIIGILFLGVLLVASIELSLILIKFGQKTPILNIPIVWQYIPASLGFLFIEIRIIDRLLMFILNMFKQDEIRQ